MNRAGFVVAAVLVLAALISQPSALTAQDNKAPATLSDLRLEFHAARAKLPDPREDLKDAYAGHLEKLLEKVSKAGDLEKAIAVKNEQEKFREGGSVSAGAEFPDLQRLQQVYAAETRKAEASMAADLAKLAREYQEQLEKLQARLTKLSKLDEAVKVKQEIAGLVILIAVPSAPAVPGKPPAETTSPALATVDLPFENSLGMRFIPIPIEGGPTGGKRILFCIWETRVKDFGAFAKKEKIELVEPEFEQEDDHPAVNLHREEAKAFCEWLTQVDRRAKLIGADDHYRVPSDHEWSCAAGIGGKEDASATPFSKMSVVPVYYWGTNAWPPRRRSGNFHGEEANGKSELFKGVDGIEGYSDEFVFTAPVGSFPPNKQGLFDIEGNVMEWTVSGWKTEGESGTAMRGCSWNRKTKAFFYLSRRHFIYHNSRRNWVGFRCVLENE